MPEKQLELSRRSAFFADPFFADLHASLGDGLEKRLAEISARALGLTGAGLREAAHNIQVTASNDKFQVQLELPGFEPEDFSLKTKDDLIIVEAVHEAKNDNVSKMLNSSMEGGMKMPRLSDDELSHQPPFLLSAKHSHLSIRDEPQGAENRKLQETNSADTGVLLKYKEGSDYKLALNMQQFSPEDITIKLNGNKLIIEAGTSEEQFRQKHHNPDNSGF